MLGLLSGLQFNKLFPDSCSSPEISGRSLQSLKMIHRKEAPLRNIRDIGSMHAFPGICVNQSRSLKGGEWARERDRRRMQTSVSRKAADAGKEKRRNNE